jgi:hypothetical protein
MENTAHRCMLWFAFLDLNLAVAALLPFLGVLGRHHFLHLAEEENEGELLAPWARARRRA